MTWKLEIDPVRRLVTFHLKEGFTPEDFVEGTDAIRTHPEFSPDLRQIIICDNSFSEGFTGDVVSKLARDIAIFSKSSRRAVVVSRDLDFGIARMFALLKDGSTGEIAVFRELQEALSWLESDED